MLAAEARAKAEAARTKAAYAKRQVDMEVEKARIDATLNALKEEGEAEATSAAANVLEAAVDIEFKEHQNKSSHFSSAQQSMQRTSEYVNAHYNNQQRCRTPQTTEQHNMEVRSQSNTSSSSRRSSRLGVNMLAAEARAKAEAARTKAAYAKRQVDMEVEKARIDACFRTTSYSAVKSGVGLSALGRRSQTFRLGVGSS
ncbi:hypothetical protein F7725_018868 [Dissostichus mawsoni]|uniref:Uncharacterized protein n=1 Tax=Dissostichus mawsoni TaxID=36200 RepID=A0A7J5XTD1_DISMA|nr:hypothetical protein F7725_018868 [Dissostichus mawsoni]